LRQPLLVSIIKFLLLKQCNNKCCQLLLVWNKWNQLWRWIQRLILYYVWSTCKSKSSPKSSPFYYNLTLVCDFVPWSRAFDNNIYTSISASVRNEKKAYKHFDVGFSDSTLFEKYGSMILISLPSAKSTQQLWTQSM